MYCLNQGVTTLSEARRYTPPHEIHRLHGDAVVVLGIGIEAEENRFPVGTQGPFLGHPRHNFSGPGVKLDQRDLDVVIQFSPERVVGIRAERTDRGREGRDEVAERARPFSIPDHRSPAVPSRFSTQDHQADQPFSLN